MGLSFSFFAPLRSGYNSDTNGVYDLVVRGSLRIDGTNNWFAVRPAHELTCICRSERSEESHSIMGHFGKPQCDKAIVTVKANPAVLAVTA